MRLLWVEIRRLFARRFFWIGSVALIVGLGAVLLLTALESHVPTDAEWDQARAAAAAEAPRAEAERQRCLDDQRTGSSNSGYPADTNCNVIQPPPPEEFLQVQPFRFGEEIVERTQVLSFVLTMFAFLVGATAIGAEWHHGTLAALLLWEPRRLRVFAAKLGALVLGATVVAALGYVANVAGHLGVAATRGVVGEVPAALQQEVALNATRGLAMALVGGAIGFAIAFTLRRTAAALGVLLGYLAIFEVGARMFFGSSDRWLATTFVRAWLFKDVIVSSYDCDAGGACGLTTFHVTMWQGGAYLLTAGFLTVLVAALVFRRREVA